MAINWVFQETDENPGSNNERTGHLQEGGLVKSGTMEITGIFLE